MSRAENQGQQKGSGDNSSGWGIAHHWLAQYLNESRKADEVLASSRREAPAESAWRARRLYQTALRWMIRVESTLAQQWRRPPRPALRALLLLAGAEIVESPDRAPAITHAAVAFAGKQLSKGEARFSNAVLRKSIPGLLGKEPDTAADSPAAMALHYSHPPWLVRRWILQFGMAQTLELLRWNQSPPHLYVRMRKGTPPPDGCHPSPWSGYWHWDHNQRAELLPLLKQGLAYVQDPFARSPVALLSPEPGMRILELCAAPGGKSTLLAEHMQGKGELHCVDLPGPRLDRLRANLGSLPESWQSAIHIHGLDLTIDHPDHAPPAEWKGRFDAVMLDTPCGNTGVIRRRPDVKNRLTEESLAKITEIQRKLLTRAIQWVRPGGRLVYSTCSLEPEENRQQIETLLASPEGRSLQCGAFHEHFPPRQNHDGGGVYLLSPRDSQISPRDNLSANPAAPASFHPQTGNPTA